ncbi:glucosaminidase domain-containing protein [Marinobacter sp. M216]|uniref:Glucosaminidase domain-containing protein n=1 Tax=Marinobacter albus TaxID=3030833 RepID=A0ABT7HA52_9GAMM|nr:MULTISPECIES: glucosaminidase domain-containing protein [unclassified Marinobacter]MBW7470510.1 glucosaminidase domain-containing protein [Marinobacter sp. F4218]MDK9557222.1 glucosaminidase domain-containing protein [Marinobacter sp. M216]
MSAGKRALMLFVPLIAFAIGGGFYVPQSGMEGYRSGSELPLASLPSLPSWAHDGLPDFASFRDTTEKKAAFFSFLYPRIVLANSRILIERDYLDSLAGKSTLSEDEQQWLAAQADRLRVEAEPGSDEQFSLLRKRLDVIPPSLILAQAANESAWGTSRFATKGYNLFGQWCFSKGCGLVPRGRVEGASHEVAKFSSPYRSVRAYIQNLNRHPTYQALRDIRLKDRRDDDPLSGVEMAQGLLGYSERGEDYVKEIRSMIHYNNLSFYDNDFRDVISDLTPDRLQELASASPETVLLPGQKAPNPGPAEG